MLGSSHKTKDSNEENTLTLNASMQSIGFVRINFQLHSIHLNPKCGPLKCYRFHWGLGFALEARKAAKTPKSCWILFNYCNNNFAWSSSHRTQQNIRTLWLVVSQHVTTRIPCQWNHGAHIQISEYIIIPNKMTIFGSFRRGIHAKRSKKYWIFGDFFLLCFALFNSFFWYLTAVSAFWRVWSEWDWEMA